MYLNVAETTINPLQLADRTIRISIMRTRRDGFILVSGSSLPHVPLSSAHGHIETFSQHNTTRSNIV